MFEQIKEKPAKLLLFILPFLAGGLMFLPFWLFGNYEHKEAEKVETDETDFVTGKLHVVEGAKDEQFGIETDNPVLVRKTEMYQHIEVKISTDETTEEEGYTEEAVGDFSTRQEDSFDKSDKRVSREKYDNPEFPEELRSAVFYGKVEIGEDGVQIGESVIDDFYDEVDSSLQDKKDKTFRNISCENCLTEAKGLPDVNDLSPKIVKQFKFHKISENEYATNNGDGPDKIGDLRVTYMWVDPELLDDTYTATGELSDGVIDGGETVSGGLWGKKITAEDMAAEDKEEGHKFASGVHLVGGLLGFGVFMVALIIILVVISQTNDDHTKSGVPKS